MCILGLIFCARTCAGAYEDVRWPVRRGRSTPREGERGGGPIYGRGVGPDTISNHVRNLLGVICYVQRR